MKTFIVAMLLLFVGVMSYPRSETKTYCDLCGRESAMTTFRVVAVNDCQSHSLFRVTGDTTAADATTVRTVPCTQHITIEVCPACRDRLIRALNLKQKWQDGSGDELKVMFKNPIWQPL